MNGHGATLPCVLAIAASLILAAPTDAATSPRQAAWIAAKQVFKKYAGQAIQVAYCETGGTFSTTARNGQYLGLYQMGSWERRTYAYGRYTTALEQTQAAYRYFVASGYSWRAWECRPW